MFVTRVLVSTSAIALLGALFVVPNAGCTNATKKADIPVKTETHAKPITLVGDISADIDEHGVLHHLDLYTDDGRVVPIILDARSRAYSMHDEERVEVHGFLVNNNPSDGRSPRFRMTKLWVLEEPLPVPESVNSTDELLEDEEDFEDEPIPEAKDQRLITDEPLNTIK